MSTYLLGIVGTVLLCSLLTAILPNGKTSTLIKGIAKLACLLAIVAPVSTFLQAYNPRDETDASKNDETFLEESGIQTDETFIQYYSERRIAFAERALERELNEKFNCEVTVQYAWDWYSEDVLSLYTDRTIIITRITVCGESLSEEEQNAVIAYISKYYCREVLIE